MVPAYDPVPLEVGAAMAALKAAGGRVVKEKPKLDSLTWDFPKNTLPQSHDTKALAEIALHASSGWTEERLKSWLVRAEALGLVTRPRGERSGWAFTEAGYSLFFAQESESRAEVATEAGSVYSESSSCQARGSIEVAPPVAVTSDEASITHALADEGPREEGCGLDPVEAFATAVRQMGVGGHASATTCSASASALGWAEIVASLSDEKPDESPPPASYHGCPIPRQIERVGPIPQG